MAWEKTSEHVDEARGVHEIIFEDRAANPPAKHFLLIHIGHDHCAQCGHVKPKDNLGDLDPRALAAIELEALTASMDNIKAYGRKHRLQGKKS